MQSGFWARGWIPTTLRRAPTMAERERFGGERPIPVRQRGWRARTRQTAMVVGRLGGCERRPERRVSWGAGKATQWAVAHERWAAAAWGLR